MQEMVHPALIDTTAEAWELVVEGFEPRHERAVESLLAVGNGYLGTRASLAEGHPSSDPGTFIAGVYDHFARPGPVPELIRTADWLALAVSVEGERLSLETGSILEHRRVLDLRRGVVTRIWRHRDRAGRITRLRLFHCASLADRHALLQRLELTAENYTGQIAVDLFLDARRALRPEAHRDFIGRVQPPVTPKPVARLLPLSNSGEVLALRTAGSGIVVAEAIATHLVDLPDATAVKLPVSAAQTGKRWTWMAAAGRTYHLDKLVAVETSRDVVEPVAAARSRLAHLAGAGADSLLSAHERAWSSRWEHAGTKLEGAPEIQRSLRLAAYHLVSAANPTDGRVSIGARGLTGEAYRGHVFWDTEIFMLPFFVLTDPPAARSLLLYRYHTLPAARAKARRLGYRGALYAWESAADGEEATPTEVIGPNDVLIPILSGAEEHHISADVAYAVWQYWQATQDEQFLLAAGAEILCETARFWGSRAHAGADGRFHIRGVIGPDEYHDGVDDNAYTNLLARWNLRRGVEVTALLQHRWPAAWRRLQEHLRLSAKEISGWQDVAEALVDGLDAKTGLIEQFAGYFRLEDIDLTALEPRAVPVDVLLGPERVRQSQAIKQADVLMALYLLWDEFALTVHAANFHYYEPRTAHGSSLSPGIHAAFAARLGELDLAERYLRETAAIDLDDQMGNAAGGVHLGAMGSLWQAVVLGFMGVSLHADSLTFLPRLPATWKRFRCSLRWRGRTLALTVSGDPPSWSLSLTAGPSVRVGSDAGRLTLLAPGEAAEQAGLGEMLRIAEAD